MTDFGATTTRIDVRPGDLDSVGHVNNARALEYLEHGRWHWLERHSLARRCSVVPVVMRAELDYADSIGWTAIEVHTRLAELPDVTEDAYRAVFHQSIALPRSTRAAVRATVQVAFVDPVTQALRSVADFLAAARSAAAVPRFNAESQETS